MSGIAVVRDADPARLSLCRALVDAMPHRGRASLQEAGDVAFGAQVDGGVTRDGVVVIVDGEVHNRRELAEAGVDAIDVDASTVIASAYARWGVDAATRLVGDFAFVLYDAQNKALWCVRDRLGMRPLYYHRDGERLLVASEAQALRASKIPSARPNTMAVAKFIACLYAEEGETLREQIEALPPGHYLHATPERFEVRRYWRPDPWRKLDVDDEEAAAMFADAFSEAVRCRLPNDGKLGVMLSGGLDSASVACQASALGTTPTALHVSIAGYDCDETPLSNAVARKWGLDTIDIAGDGADMAAAFEPRMRHPDTIYHVSNASFAALLPKARTAGIDTVMTGVGGDECADETGGELVDALRSGNVREVATIAALDRTPLSWAPYRRLWGMGVKRWVPERLRLATRHLRPRPLVPYLTRSWAKRVRDQHDEERMQRLAEGWPDDTSAEMCTRIQQFPIRVGAAQVNLIGALSGLDVVHPFLDVRVFELALAMPRAQRLRRGWLKNKPMLRRSMAKLLPAQVAERRDAADFSRYLRDVYLQHHRRHFGAFLEHSRLAELGIIDLDAVRSRFGVGLPDDASLNHFGLILSMELWLRQDWS